MLHRPIETTGVLGGWLLGPRPQFRRADLSGFGNRVTEGLSNSSKHVLVTGGEGKKCISVGDVGLGLNPIELLPKETDKISDVRVVQRKAKKVHKRGDLARQLVASRIL